MTRSFFRLTRVALALLLAVVGLHASFAPAALRPPLAQAGLDAWTTNGPFSAHILSLAVSPAFATDSIVYAGTHFNGVFKSSDGGANWTSLDIPLTPLRLMSTEGQIRSMAFLPDDDNSLLVGTMVGVYRTRDRGASWESFNDKFATCQASPPEVWSIVSSPDYRHDSTVYIAGRGNMMLIPPMPPTWQPTCMVQDHIFKYTTEGGTGRWQTMNWFPFRMMALAPTPTYATDHTLFIGAYDGLRRVVDAGYYFTATVQSLTDYSVAAIAVSPDYARDHTVFAGTSNLDPVGITPSQAAPALHKTGPRSLTDDARPAPPFVPAADLAAEPASAPSDHKPAAGLFKSTDGGATWQAMSEGLAGAARDIRAIALSPAFATDHTLFIATMGGPYASTDGGATWQPRQVGLPSGGAVTAIALSPPLSDGGRMVFAGTAGNGVYRSDNEGLTWESKSKGLTDLQINHVAPAPSYDHNSPSATMFVATGNSGVWMTQDHGQGWWSTNNGLGDPDVHTVAVSPAYGADHTLLAGTAHGLYRSSDSGNTWHLIPDNPPPNRPLDVVLFSPRYTADQTIFAGSRDGGIFRSTDGGLHWSTLSTLPLSELVISPDYDRDHTLFAGTLWGVFRSTDGGLTWQGSVAGMPYPRVQALAISPAFTTDRTLWASVQSASSLFGVFYSSALVRSTDGGLTWTELVRDNDGLNGIVSLAVSPNYAQDHLLLAGRGSPACLCGQGVFASTDGGASWTAFNEGLNTRWPMPYALTFSPGYSQDGAVFVGLNNGLWSRSIVKPDSVRTLILAPRQRFRRLFSLEAAEDLFRDLTDLANAPGVAGIIVDLDGSGDSLKPVRDAYAAWDATPTTDKANALVAAIQAVIRAQRARNPHLESVVLVGGDRLIPFRRLTDPTRYPESHYLNALPPPSGGATVSVAVADNTTLTDDDYARLTDDATPAGLDLTVGRLVETPAEIGQQITAFMGTDLSDTDRAPTLTPTGTSLIVGHSDEAPDAAETLATVVSDAFHLPASLLDGPALTRPALTWQLFAAPHDLTVLLDQPDHTRLMTVDGDLDVAGMPHEAVGTPRYRLVVSLGSHGGLSVPGATATNGDDIAQTLTGQGAALVAPTGYAWTMRDTGGLTPALVRTFLTTLGQPSGSGGARTLGDALRSAKRQYWLNHPDFDAYDAKVVAQLTLYGLPMLRVEPQPVASARPVQTERPASHPVTLNPANGWVVGMAAYAFPGLNDFRQHTVADQAYYSYGADGDARAVAGYPLLPVMRWGVESSGSTARGSVFKGGRYHTETLAPRLAVPLLPGVSGDVATAVWEGWYPALPTALRTHPDERPWEIITLASARRISGGRVEERLLDTLEFDVLSSDAPDHTPPHIGAVTATVQPGQAVVRVAAADAETGVWRVLVTGTTEPSDGQGEWQTWTLAREGDHWVVSIPLTGGTFTFIVQVADAAGNVAADDNGGRYYTVSP